MLESEKYAGVSRPSSLLQKRFENCFLKQKPVIYFRIEKII